MINEYSGTNSKNNKYTIDDAFVSVKNEVDATLSTSPSLMKEYTGYLADSSGKYIRALSVLACALDTEDQVHENAVKLGASIEVLHLATLVHDDVIDNAETRRGQLSLQKKYGKRTAVICGDYLLCVSLILAGSITEKEDYLNINVPDYMTKVCMGEMRQEINNANYDLTVLEYLRIISGKTAALFEASFHAGAILSGKGVPEEIVRRYARLGRYIGMIFQLTDDCMDYESTTDIAMKPVQSDYEQDVITLPLIYTFDRFEGLRSKAALRKVSAEEIKAAVISAGGLEYTKSLAGKYYEKAISIIDSLEISELKRTTLTTILNKAYRIS